MTANQALNSYFFSIPRGERNNEVRKLADSLQVSYTVVQNWRLGYTKIKPVFAREISRIIGKDIFENVTD